MALDPKVIRTLVQKNDPIIFEVGANIGHDTQKLLNEFNGIHLYCFEPDPRCIRIFKQRIHDARCHLIESAASNIDGTTTFHLSTGWPEAMIPPWMRLFGLTRLILALIGKEWLDSSSIKKPISNPKDYPGLSFTKAVTVKTTRLDTFILANNIHAIDLLWADVQGAERDLIQGLGTLIANCRFIYLEYGERSTYPEAMTREETVSLLQQHGFETVNDLSSIGPSGNLLFRNTRP
jgi:FkbM family methyltransferase